MTALDSIAVLIAPPSQRPILDALVDLSAAGVVGPFTWIEAAPDPSRAPDREDPRALAVADGEVTASSFAAQTNQRGLRRVREVVVVPVGHPEQDALSAAAENFYQGLDVVGGARTQHVRVIVPWSAEPLPAELGRPGWHGVMLSPESTAEPDFTAVPWWGRPETIPGAAASGIAVQAGILRGLEEAPVDDAGQSISADIEVIRTFARRVDADAVESGVRHRVLHLGEDVPAPTRSGGASVPPFASPQTQVRETAQAWADAHESEVRRRGPQLPPSTGETVGILAAVKLFLSFLLQALVSAPENWLRRTLHSAQTTLAGGATATIFGRDSAVSVIVGGVGPDGSTAGWRQIRDAARELESAEARGRARSGQPARREFSSLWTDLLQAGRGLLDGSGANRLGLEAGVGYVPSRSLISLPLDGDGSYSIEEPIGSLPGDLRLHAWDQLEIQRVRHELERTVQTGAAGAQSATKHLAGIDGWCERTGRSLLPLIGAHLSRWFAATRQDIRRVQTELDRLQSTDPDAQLGRTQRILAWILRGLLLVAVIVGIVLGVLAHQGTIETSTLWIGLAITAAIWLIASFMTFFLMQREVFRLLHLRSERDQRLPVLREMLRMASEDLVALGDAYDQFDHWAMLQTCFLAAPLGQAREEDGAITLRTQLPAGIQAPRATAPDPELDDVAAQLRTTLFGIGWLDEAHKGFEATLLDDLTPDQRIRVRQSGGRPLTKLLASSADQGSELSLWTEAVRRRGVRSAHGERMWEHCLGRLTSERLLDLRIAQGDGAQQRSESLEALRSELFAPRRSAIVDAVLDIGSRTHESRQVEPGANWSRDVPVGLGSTVVLVQSTRPIPQEGFVYPLPRADDPNRWDAPDSGQPSDDPIF